MKISWFGVTKVTFFGYVVTNGTWKLTDSRKEAISKMVFPSSVKQMQSFLGATLFFRTHIPHYSDWAKHLYECTDSKFNYKDETTWKRDYKKLFEDFKVCGHQGLHPIFPGFQQDFLCPC